MTQPIPDGQPPVGTVLLTVQGSRALTSAVTPTARINGYPVKVRYGQNAIPVYAGPVHIDLSAQWLRTYGQASIDFTLAPGQSVPVFYAAPLHQFTTGSIGFTKVKHKGKWFYALLLLIIAVALTFTFINLFSSI